MTELLSFLAICIAVAVLLNVILHLCRPLWSRRRIALISAFPVPSIALAICIYVFIGAATASAEKCGVDACGMAMMFATFGAGIAVAGFATGVIACECINACGTE